MEQPIIDSGNDNKPNLQKKRQALKFGKLGEQMALRYLSGLGYIILEQNYRRGHLEIDLIALDNDELVIVEVKSRANSALIQPEESVTHKKRHDLIRLANEYVRSHDRTENVRFDIITVISPQGTLSIDNPQGIEIKHLKNAYNVMSY